MARAKSGRIASLHIPLGNLSQTGWSLMTYDAANIRATYGTVGDDFWYHSDKYEMEIRLNGVVSASQNWITPSATSNNVKVLSFTYYINGVSYTVSTASVGSLVIATSASARFVYAVCASAGGLYSLNAGSAAATTSRGVAGGPPFISADGIVLAYVTRASTGADIITLNEISLTDFSGTEWANPKATEFRPLLRRVIFDELPAAVHTGSTYPNLYARGYSFSNNFPKAGQIIDWKYAISENREEATTQNAGRNENDKSRPGYTFSGNKFVSAIPDEIFTNQNTDDSTDVIVKMFHDKTQTAKYQVAQMGLGVDFDLPLADKQKASITGEITGYIEEIG